MMPGSKGGPVAVAGQGGPPPTVGNATQQPPQSSNSSPGPRSHTPPHQAYLKQHLQVFEAAKTQTILQIIKVYF